MTWHSNIQGYLGSGFEIYPSLVPGRHTITARVRDSHGAEVSQNFTVLIATTRTSEKDLDGDGLSDDVDPFPKHAFWVKDEDKDHIADEWELQYFGNLRSVNLTTDFDRDGHLDAIEFQNGTSPRVQNKFTPQPPAINPKWAAGWNLVSGAALDQFGTLNALVNKTGADMVLSYQADKQIWDQVYLAEDDAQVVDWEYKFDPASGYWVHIPALVQ